MTIEVAFSELFEYESTKSVYLTFVKPEKCSLFLFHTFPYAFFFFFCLLLSSKAVPLLVLPLLCCLSLTFLLWRSLSSKHLSCFYALSLLTLHSFFSEAFSSSPSHPYYWLYSCSRFPPAFSHTAAIPVPTLHCLWGRGAICRATCQVWRPRLCSWAGRQILVK